MTSDTLMLTIFKTVVNDLNFTLIRYYLWDTICGVCVYFNLEIVLRTKRVEGFHYLTSCWVRACDADCAATCSVDFIHPSTKLQNISLSGMYVN